METPASGAGARSAADRLMEEATRAVVVDNDEVKDDPVMSAQEQADIRMVMLKSFLKLSNTFLASAANVWKACPTLASWKAASDAIQAIEDEDERLDAGKAVIAEFFSATNSYFTQIEAKDASFMVFDEEGRFDGEDAGGSKGERYMKEINAASKWRLASPQIRETCWQYLRMLSRYATVYTVYEKIPPGMFATMLKVAAKLNERRENGGINLSELTSKGLVSTGNQILENIDPKERDEFTRALMDDESSEAIMAALQSLVGGGAGGQGAGPNLASMLAQAKGMRRR